MPAALVPEFAVRDCRASLAFYRGVLGFKVRYQRPEEGFAYLELGAAELMIDQIGLGRDFPTAPLEPPFGRGLNLQIQVEKIAPLVEALEREGIPLVLPVEDRWYLRGQKMVGQRQFVVADPDGYLLRFQESLGEREATIKEIRTIKAREEMKALRARVRAKLKADNLVNKPE